MLRKTLTIQMWSQICARVASFGCGKQIHIFGTFLRKYLQNFRQPKLATLAKILDHHLIVSFFIALILDLITRPVEV